MLFLVFRAVASCLSPEIKKPRLDQQSLDCRPQVFTCFLSISRLTLFLCFVCNWNVFSVLISTCFDYCMWLPFCQTISYQILVSIFCSNSAVVAVFAFSYQLKVTAVEYRHWNVSCWMSWMISVICSALFVSMSGCQFPVHLQLIYSVFCCRGL